jgi:N-acetylglucosamine kinase-like BadF-type ATPase
MSFLIADSGSTKTDWVLVDNGHILVKTQTKGFNPYFQTSTEIYGEIKNYLIPQLNQHLDSIQQIYYYGAGCSAAEKILIVKEALTSAFGSIELDINHDLLAAARALCGQESGIACILGTGSNSCLYDGKNVIENVPSVGYMFGDHGSGANIGKTFVQHYFDERLPEHLKLSFEKAGYNREIILENVYKQPMPSRYLASIMSFLLTYSQDDYVKGLIKHCFINFIDTQVSKYADARQLNVNSVGSIAYYYQDILHEALTEKGFGLGNIIKSPIDGLIIYHHS